MSANTVDFLSHRQRLLDRLEDDEAVLLFGVSHAIRNGDAEYRYRPHSDLYWLTGWKDPEVAVFVKHGEAPFTIFVQPKNKAMEIWTGVRPGPQGAVDDFGLDVAHEFGDLPDILPELLKGIRKLHYGFAEDSDNDAILMGSVRKAARTAGRKGMPTPDTFYSPTRMLHELRLIKGPDEVATLQEAARITEIAHREAMRTTVPGKTEYEIESQLQYIFRREGGDGPGYTPIVAGGANACILHYINNDQPLKDGDLLLIDAGCEFAFYTADVTRTFPVNGKFSEPQRRVYNWVLKAQEAAIECIRPGTPYEEIGKAALRVLVEGMLDMDLLEGTVEENMESQSYKRFYMHGIGHWLGLDVHDVGDYGRNGGSRPLEPGMVLTVEPGIYIADDDETVPPEYRGIGVRIEDNLMVTAGAPLNLTAGIPKTIEEVEEACK
jgi:Xaa-Pro aminopeptidase